MAQDIPEFTEDEFQKHREQQREAKNLKKKRVAEASAMGSEDARIRATVDARGLVQVNIRMPPTLKNDIIASARAAGQGLHEHVCEVLKVYVQKRSK